jgi:GntR family transcriptional repressor for pyruvate dehydrogenase complex
VNALPLTPETRSRRPAYAADEVFGALAAELLQGRPPPGAALPPEGALSGRFRVSKLLVRQALHRLAELGLVEIRQGGATRALDARDADDLRVIELLYKLAPRSAQARALSRDVLEKQFTQGLSLVEVFGRRAPRRERSALVEWVDRDVAACRSPGALADFEQRFWSAVADGGGNRVLRAEVRWWYRRLAEKPATGAARPLAARLAFYRELARRLRDDADAITFYLASFRPTLDALFKRSSRGA